MKNDNSSKNKKIVIVVGGGPSGMMAAITARNSGKEVILIEKNPKLGRKLLLTGNGRCNISHSGDISSILSQIPINSKFFSGIYRRFSNNDLIEFLNKLNVTTHTESDGRVFPQSNKAEDLLNALINEIKRVSVKVIYDRVLEIKVINNQVKSVICSENNEILCDSIILATGGMSYPGTGSTGDGHKIAGKLGHNITLLSPALVQLYLKDPIIKDLTGISFINVKIVIMNEENKSIFKGTGEILFTHKGISGPVILNGSIHINKLLADRYKLIIDFRPDIEINLLEKTIINLIDNNSKKSIQNTLEGIIPRRLLFSLIKRSNIPESRISSELKKDERRRIIDNIKHLELSISESGSFEEAMITTGGISINEINPKTLESRIIKNLFFAGEILDITGYSGGYNLQIAFSSGYTAGLNA